MRCAACSPSATSTIFFTTIERYAESRGHWMAMLRAEPLFDPARADPRFAELVNHRINAAHRPAPIGRCVSPIPFRWPGVCHCVVRH
jgi:hypothetical protein